MAHATTLRTRAGRMPAFPARKMGTWKIAYADFLTALMAFFLLMWLVSGVSRKPGRHCRRVQAPPHRHVPCHHRGRAGGQTACSAC